MNIVRVDMELCVISVYMNMPDMVTIHIYALLDDTCMLLLPFSFLDTPR